MTLIGYHHSRLNAIKGPNYQDKWMCIGLADN